MTYLYGDPCIPPCVFWDTDGTLVNSEPVHEIRWNRVAAQYGVSLTPADFDKSHRFPIQTNEGEWMTIERPLRGAHENVICWWIIHQMRKAGTPEAKLPTPQDMKAPLFEEYRANAHLIEPRPEIPWLMEKLHDEGFYMGNVTGCDDQIARINLGVLGDIPTVCLDFIITACHTTEHKPHRAPYDLAVSCTQISFESQLGVALTPEYIARHSVAIEDSPSGARSGLRAGLLGVIQFLNPGQEPYQVQRDDGHNPANRLYIARTAQDIYNHLQNIFGALPRIPVAHKPVFGSQYGYAHPYAPHNVLGKR